MPADTTIGISKAAWRKLNARKHPGDGFDDVILRLVDDETNTEIPTLRDGERGAGVSTGDTAEWCNVPVDARQQLLAGRMALTGTLDGVGGGPTDQHKAVEYCADTLANADSFSAPIGWQTNIVPNLTVEELIGGFLAAADTSHLTDEREP